MQNVFDSLRAFAFNDADVHLWIYKKSTAVKKYSAHYVQTDQALTEVLKNLAVAEMTRITEFAAYSYLSQTNENSCLALTQEETDFSLLKAQVDRPEPECRTQGVEDLKGAEGYLVKFTKDGETVYAVKRSSSSWKTSYPKKYINITFRAGELSAVEDNTFSIERNFDFFAKGLYLFIANKRALESTLAYRTGYSQAFCTLQQNPSFSALFTDLQPLISYVGNNSIQLRRMAVIEQKGLYSQQDFLVNLQRVSLTRNWVINFEPNTNKIVPCTDTVKTILQVLLDHRLISEVTNYMYDVPDAVQI